ncbi:hypothetical protein ABZZ44_17995 [Streptomyces sp. NPDC006460]|uniref:hypothetical protein n=1 Tax=Streptomyces sp. NPDC006460 TaxID=3154304 RepID=UPI0033BE7620
MQMDWARDEILRRQVREMGRPQRYEAAAVALRRLQAPLLNIPMPAEWGIPFSAVQSIAQYGQVELGVIGDEELHDAVSKVAEAPLFESELSPNVYEEIQLDTLAGWMALEGVLGEMDESTVFEIIRTVRALVKYVDDWMAYSDLEFEGESARRAYLAALPDTLRVFGLGYFGSRNIDLERQCHEAILKSSDGDGSAFTLKDGRDLLEKCDEYGNEVLAVLRYRLAG